MFYLRGVRDREGDGDHAVWRMEKLLARSDGVNRQVAKENFCGLAVQGFEGGHEFEKVRSAQLEAVFLRLILRAGGVIDVGRRRLFDVASEDVGDGMGLGKLHESLRAGDVG